MLEQSKRTLDSLSPRAKRRLRLAMQCGLLPGSLKKDQAEDEILRAVNQLPVGARQRLKELVDWVEDYEKHEHSFGD